MNFRISSTKNVAQQISKEEERKKFLFCYFLGAVGCQAVDDVLEKFLTALKFLKINGYEKFKYSKK